jgi:putative transposase
VKEQVVQQALEHTELSLRELACRITDTKEYFISESSVYRILKSHDLITSPAYILMQASDSFKNPTQQIHELWQTNFTYFRIIGWGWYYLSKVLDDFSRHIIACKLFTSMTASNVNETLY